MFESIKTTLTSPVVLLVIAAFVVLGFVNKSGKGGESIRKGVASLLGGVASIWSKLIFHIPGVSSIASRFVNHFDKEWIQSCLDKRYAKLVQGWLIGDSEDRKQYASEKLAFEKSMTGGKFLAFDVWMETRMPPELRMLRGTWGDRLKCAVARYPKIEFPSMWIRKIPEDLKRSLVSDGRLITGDPMSLIAECSITSKHQELAAKAGAAAFVVWFSLLLAVWHPGLIMGGASSTSLASGSADVSKVANDDGLIGKSLSKDYWDQGAYRRAIADRKAELVNPRSSEITPELVLTDLASSIVVALSVGLLMALSSFRGVFRAALAAIGKNVHDGTKEQILRWNHRWDIRDMDYKSYCEQLFIDMKIDLSPKFDLGKATGICRFRGKMDAPYKNQRVKTSAGDTNQHVLAFGGTGQGKTRSFILPFINQTLEMRRVERDRAIELRESYLARVHPEWTEEEVKSEAANLPKSRSASTKAAGEFVWPWGVKPNMDVYEEIIYPSDNSIYVTDVKAVLCHDLKEITAKLRLQQDLMVIGTNEAAGEVSVDLLDGIQPQLVADIIRSVARQSGGGEGDNFWPDMATDLIRNCAVLARAFDRTDEGIEWVRKHRGERPYSLVFIFQLAMDKGALLHTVLSALGRAEDDPNLYPRIKEFHTTELDGAVQHMQETWMTMVPETKVGIQANVINIMQVFSSNPILRASFAGGAGKNQVSVDQFWGRLCVTNVSSLDFGSAGTIINVFLKTLFMTEATRRERDTKTEMSAIEHKFFRMFPRLSEADIPLEDIKRKLDNPGMYTSAQIDSFSVVWEAAGIAWESFYKALSAANIDVPENTKGIVRTIDDNLALLDNVGDELGALVQQAQLDHQALREARATFTRNYRILARKPVFLKDQEIIRPGAVAEKIRAMSNLILQDIAEELESEGKDIDITTENEAIRAAHELIYQWKVLETRLGGTGKGAVRERMFFFADEYQALITVDPKEGAMSDSNFPNIGRSTAVALIIATQSYAAFKLAIGEDGMQNFCDNMRTKVFLQVENTATIEFIKKLAGKALRSYVYDNNSYESYDTMLMMQSGATDLAMDGVPDIAILNNDPTNPALLAAGVEMALSPASLVSANDSVRNFDKTKKVDLTFVPKKRKVRGRGGNIDSNEDQIQAAKQQATWRGEDLQHKTLSEGNQEMDVFSDGDFFSMGRNHAFMIVQRAGKTRMDFVELDGEEYRNIVM